MVSSVCSRAAVAAIMLLVAPSSLLAGTISVNGETVVGGSELYSTPAEYSQMFMGRPEFREQYLARVLGHFRQNAGKDSVIDQVDREVAERKRDAEERAAYWVRTGASSLDDELRRTAHVSRTHLKLAKNRPDVEVAADIVRVVDLNGGLPLVDRTDDPRRVIDNLDDSMSSWLRRLVS